MNTKSYLVYSLIIGLFPFTLALSSPLHSGYQITDPNWPGLSQLANWQESLTLNSDLKTTIDRLSSDKQPTIAILRANGLFIAANQNNNGPLIGHSFKIDCQNTTDTLMVTIDQKNYSFRLKDQHCQLINQYPTSSLLIKRYPSQSFFEVIEIRK